MKFARSGQPALAYGWPGVLAGEPASGPASRRHRASASIRRSIQTCLGVIVGDDLALHQYLWHRDVLVPVRT